MEQNMVVIPMASPQTGEFAATARIRRSQANATVEIKMPGGKAGEGLQYYLITSGGARLITANTVSLKNGEWIFGLAAFQKNLCICRGFVNKFEKQFESGLTLLRLSLLAPQAQSEIPGAKSSQAISHSTADFEMPPVMAAAEAINTVDAVQTAGAVDTDWAADADWAADTADALETAGAVDTDWAAGTADAVETVGVADAEAEQPKPDGAVVAPSTRYKAVLGQEPPYMQDAVPVGNFQVTAAGYPPDFGNPRSQTAESPISSQAPEFMEEKSGQTRVIELVKEQSVMEKEPAQGPVPQKAEIDSIELMPGAGRNGLLRYTERCSNPFAHQFPGSSWVKVCRMGGESCYYEGTMRKGNAKITITAVPGEYSPVPPKNLQEFKRFVQTKSGGYWVKIKQ